MKIIISECVNNTYGLDCTETCGNCLGSMPCHHINGSCVYGCAPGFTGDKCAQGILDFLLIPTCMCYL